MTHLRCRLEVFLELLRSALALGSTLFKLGKLSGSLVLALTQLDGVVFGDFELALSILNELLELSKLSVVLSLELVVGLYDITVALSETVDLAAKLLNLGSVR